MAGADVAHAAGDHDGLVVAAAVARVVPGQDALQGAEVTAQLRAAEFVGVGGGADGALQHDLQRAGDAPGGRGLALPGLGKTGDAQVGHGEAGEPGLGMGTAAGGAFVPDLAAHAGSCTGERGDGGGVVVGLHLHHQVGRLGKDPVAAGVRVRVERLRRKALGHCRVVAVGHQHALGPGGVALADHGEQGVRLGLAVDPPVGVEDLVPAVLRVRLGEHHEFHVRGIAPQPPVALQQVVDLVRRQGQAEPAVRPLQGLPAVDTEIHPFQGGRCGGGEQGFQLRRLGGQHLYQRVVQQAQGGAVGQQSLQRFPATEQGVDHGPLDAPHRVESALAGNVGSLAGPRGDGARPGRHPAGQAPGRHRRRLGRQPAVVEQRCQPLMAARIQGLGQIHQVQVAGLQAGQFRKAPAQLLQQPPVAERRQHRCALELQHHCLPFEAPEPA